MCKKKKEKKDKNPLALLGRGFFCVFFNLHRLLNQLPAGTSKSLYTGKLSGRETFNNTENNCS